MRTEAKKRIILVPAAVATIMAFTALKASPETVDNPNWKNLKEETTSYVSEDMSNGPVLKRDKDRVDLSSADAQKLDDLIKGKILKVNIEVKVRSQSEAMGTEAVLRALATKFGKIPESIKSSELNVAKVEPDRLTLGFKHFYFITLERSENSKVASMTGKISDLERANDEALMKKELSGIKKEFDALKEVKMSTEVKDISSRFTEVEKRQGALITDGYKKGIRDLTVKIMNTNKALEEGDVEAAKKSADGLEEALEKIEWYKTKGVMSEGDYKQYGSNLKILREQITSKEKQKKEAEVKAKETENKKKEEAKAFETEKKRYQELKEKSEKAKAREAEGIKKEAEMKQKVAEFEAAEKELDRVKLEEKTKAMQKDAEEKKKFEIENARKDKEWKETVQKEREMKAIEKARKLEEKAAEKSKLGGMISKVEPIAARKVAVKPVSEAVKTLQSTNLDYIASTINDTISTKETSLSEPGSKSEVSKTFDSIKKAFGAEGNVIESDRIRILLEKWDEEGKQYAIKFVPKIIQK